MTIDPDDYDLRELRRIAHNRRGRRDTDGDSPDDERSPKRSRRSRRRSSTERRQGEPHAYYVRQNGRLNDRSENGQTDGQRRNGRGTRKDQGRRNGNGSWSRDGQGRRNREETRNSAETQNSAETRNSQSSERAHSEYADDERRDEVSVRPKAEVSRPRRGEPDHDRGHDEVVRADHIARDLGFGAGEDARRPRADHLEGRRDAPAAPETVSRQAYGPGLDGDDVGRFQFDTEIRERPRGRAGAALQTTQLEELLIQETAATGRGLTKPYLTSLPDEYAAERLVFDWLEFLVLKGGYKRTMDALRYYHSVEWLSASVEDELQEYLVGFSGEVSSTTDYDVDDHHLSLVHVARLASME